MRAVTVVVHRVAVVFDDIEAVHVVDRAIGCQIVVAISHDDWRTRPDVVSQIRMRIIHTAVEHRDYNLIASFGHCPGSHRADICARRPAILSAIEQPPLAREHFIVSVHVPVAAVFVVGLYFAVEFGVFNFRQGSILRDQRLRVFAVFIFDYLEAGN